MTSHSEEQPASLTPPVQPVRALVAASAPPVEYEAYDEPAAGSGPNALTLIVNAVRRWWKIAAPIGIALAALAVGVTWWLYEPVYVASAWFHVRPNERLIAEPGRQGTDRFLQTQVALVQSPVVLGPVLQIPEIAALRELREEESPLDYLSSKIQVDPVGDSEFLKISLEGHDREDIRSIVAAASEEYLKVYNEESSQALQKMIRYLTEEQNRQSVEIKRLRENVREFTMQATGNDPYSVPDDTLGIGSRNASALQSPLGDLKSRLWTVEIEQQRLREQLDAAKRSIAVQPLVVSDEAIEAEVNMNSQVNALREELDDQAADRSDEERQALEVQLGAFELKLRQRVKEELEIQAYQQLLADQPVDVPSHTVEQNISEYPPVVQQQKVILAIQSSLNELESKLQRPTGTRRYQQVQQELKDAEQELEDIKQEVRVSVEEELQAETVRNRQEELSKLAAGLRDLEVHEEILRTNIREIEERQQSEQGEFAPRSGTITLELELARGALDRAQAVHDRIADRLLEIKTEIRAPARVELQEPARVSSIPVEKRPYRRMALFAAAGLCCPFGIAVLWEASRKRVFDAEQIRSTVNLPVLGEVACLPSQGLLHWPGTAGRHTREARIYEDSVDILSHNLAMAESLKHVHVLVIASAVPGEGKSTLASQLAAALARTQDERVLLVDGDFHAASIQAFFSVPDRAGLMDVLRAECDVDDAIELTDNPNLHVMIAGRRNGSMHHLVKNGRLTATMDQLRTEFRYIVVDSPPVLSAGDALAFGRMADATLMSVLRDVSQLPQVSLAVERLVSAGANPIGAVLGGVPSKTYTRHYGQPSRARTTVSADGQ